MIARIKGLLMVFAVAVLATACTAHNTMVSSSARAKDHQTGEQGAAQQTAEEAEAEAARAAAAQSEATGHQAGKAGHPTMHQQEQPGRSPDQQAAGQGPEEMQVAHRTFSGSLR